MGKKDIEPLNEYGQLHGLCISYWDNGDVRRKRRCVNGELHGIYEFYWSNGELSYKEYWINDECLYSERYGILNRIRFDI